MKNLVVMFPGQGSQAVGMGCDLVAADPLMRETYAEASEVLGYDLWALVQGGPGETLNSTERTQPAMLAAGVAVWRVWTEQGKPTPSVMAGHSLGEFTALVCAGALDFRDAIAAVQFRGRVMQEAVPAGAGAMAAILGLEDADVEAAVSREQHGVVAVELHVFAVHHEAGNPGAVL